MLREIAVGKPLFDNKTHYSEGMKLEYTKSGPLVIISFGNPTLREIEGFKSGQIEMSYYDCAPILFLLAKIQGCGGWMDAPFSARLYDGKNTELDWSEEIDEGMGLAMHLVLVDANTGIVKAQRMIGAQTRFSRGFRAAILKQFEQPFDSYTYDAKINKIYANYTSDDLAKRADGYFKIKR